MFEMMSFSYKISYLYMYVYVYMTGTLLYVNPIKERIVLIINCDAAIEFDTSILYSYNTTVLYLEQLLRFFHSTMTQTVTSSPVRRITVTDNSYENTSYLARIAIVRQSARVK